jgi:hypothetical protein
MSIKYTNIYYCKTFKIYPDVDFWFENTYHLATLLNFYHS